MPVPLPFSSMSFFTTWPTVTAPAQAETPVNECCFTPETSATVRPV